MSTILTLLLLLMSVANVASSTDCECFLTNGTDPQYFTSHQFWDFRSLPSYSAAPAALTSETENANAPVTSDFFHSEAWTDDWAIQTWNNSDSVEPANATDGGPTILLINSANNIYIENAAAADAVQTYLTLRTNRQESFQSTAEFDTVAQNYQYVSLRTYARVTGSAGAVAGIFTYRPANITTSSDVSKLVSSLATDIQGVQEADIEILTSGPRNVVQYTNQPSVNTQGTVQPAATTNATLPNNLDWSTWNNYRLDWTPTASEWYVNGVSVAKIEFQVPRDPAGLILNMWSDGGSWSGVMDVHEYAYLAVQWIEVVYNSTDPVNGATGAAKKSISMDSEALTVPSGCQVVCSIDNHNTALPGGGIGTPVVVSNTTSSAMSLRPWNGSGGGFFEPLAWLMGFVMVAVVVS